MTMSALHYDTIGAALAWVLQQILGDAFMTAATEAWHAVSSIVTSAMQVIIS
jgi:hypothetical protein